MVAVAATGGAGAPGGPVRAPEMRAALDGTLRELNADPERGPALRATGLRVRLSLTDLGLVLDLAAGDAPGSYLQWSFDGEPGWEPALELEMDAAAANDFLQERESLPMAISRGRVRCRCESRAVVSFLPAVRLIAEPYRRVVGAEHPSLAAAGSRSAGG